MALFQRRPQTSDPVNYVTIGLNKSVVLVGLGNPGSKYDGTRHNIGFACLDALASDQGFPGWVDKKDLKCQLAVHTLGDTRVILVKPTTFMNLSGEAVQAVSSFYKLAPSVITIVHDELDVDFGSVRSRIGGGAAGHNGIKSIIQHGFEETGRIRVGIGPKRPEQIDSADFVLQSFSTDEQANLTALRREVAAICTETIYAGGQPPTDTRSFIL